MRSRRWKHEQKITFREACAVEFHDVHFPGVDRWEVISRVMNNDEPVPHGHKEGHPFSHQLRCIIKARNPLYREAVEELEVQLKDHEGHEKRQQAIIGQWLKENEEKFAGGLIAEPGEDLARLFPLYSPRRSESSTIR